MIVAVDTVAVVVSDRKKALEWYRDVLGLDPAYVAPDLGHWIEFGPRRPLTRLHLCEMGGSSQPGPTGITLLTLDIAGDYGRLKARGVKFLSAPKREEWGEWLCQFVDPDGNEFDLKQPEDPSTWKG